jgi:hypothetical protein
MKKVQLYTFIVILLIAGVVFASIKYYFLIQEKNKLALELESTHKELTSSKTR